MPNAVAESAELATVDTDTTEAPAADTTPAVPRTLAERVENPRRLLQAVKSMAVLEGDLRTLLERAGSPNDVDAATVTWANATYTKLRGEVADLLDAEGRDDANDPIIGMPEIDDTASFSTLLLKVSQATRFISVEEAFPTMFIASKMATAQMDQQYEALNQGAAAKPAGGIPAVGLVGGGSSGPYL